MSVLPAPTSTKVPRIPELKESLPWLNKDDGLLSWIAATDHKQIGIMYIVTTVFFFLVGGVEALIMRLELGAPNNHLVSPQAYDQLFTMHGTTMIFLVIMPMLIGFSLYFVPIMIGANEIAYPRFNALGYWLFLFGGLLLYASFIGGGGAPCGAM
jgi:heme/copper-type cytochrome/quinol oxidase subunit 1